MLHFFTDGDNISGPVAGGSKYGGLVSNNITQIRLSNPLSKDIFGLSQHYFENTNWQEVLSAYQTMMNYNSSGGNSEKSKKKQPDADREACKRSGGCK